MEEKMKKMLFLMLFLGTLGIVGTDAQVRIGGNGQPNAAAVLDLNATDATNTGTKGLALPRVSLASNTAQITSGTPNLSGMLVYNTNAALGAGVYYWNGSNWVKITDGSTDANTTYSGSASITLSGTSFQRAALSGDVTAGVNSNTTTIAAAAVTMSKVAPNSIDSSRIVDGSVSTDDLASRAVTRSKIKLVNGIAFNEHIDPGAEVAREIRGFDNLNYCILLNRGDLNILYTLHGDTCRIKNPTAQRRTAIILFTCFLD